MNIDFSYQIKTLNTAIRSHSMCAYVLCSTVFCLLLETMSKVKDKIYKTQQIIYYKQTMCKTKLNISNVMQTQLCMPTEVEARGEISGFCDFS